MVTNPPVVVFVGPTAAGKTRVAIEVALLMKRVEIISCDSRLFYRGMDIGTAKPSLEEMRGVKHHMIDIADPREAQSLGEYQQRTRDLIHHLHEDGMIPFLVGGTGQYVRSVVEGWDPPTVKPDAALRKLLEQIYQQKGLDELVRWLRKLDSSSYDQIDLRNPRRVQRALEVVLISGRSFVSQRVKQESSYQIIQIGLTMPRTELYQRIDERIEKMIEMGFEAEVQKLLDAGVDPALPSMSAIGYGELADKIQGRINLEEAIILMKRRTHAYVRRQANWFKESDPEIHWFDSRVCTPQEIRDLIENQIGI